MIYSTVILNKMYSTQTCIYLRNALFRWHWEQLSPEDDAKSHR